MLRDVRDVKVSTRTNKNIVSSVEKVFVKNMAASPTIHKLGENMFVVYVNKNEKRINDDYYDSMMASIN